MLIVKIGDKVIIFPPPATPKEINSYIPMRNVRIQPQGWPSRLLLRLASWKWVVKFQD